MAQFTDILQQPDTKAASRIIVDRSAGDALNTIGNLITAGSASLEKEKAEKQRLEAGRAIGSATTDLLDLQDERTQLQLQRENVDTEIAAMRSPESPGGLEITEEEQLRLDGLQGQLSKLNQARRSGVLNDKVFAIRANALQRSALASVENLGIQTNINAIFSQGRSGPQFALDPQRQAVEQHMNKLYGNDWDESMVALEVGKQNYIASMTSRGAKALAENSTGTISTYNLSLQNLNQGFMETVRKQGGVYSQDQQFEFARQIHTSLMATMQEFDKKVAADRARGLIISNEDIKKVKDGLKEQAKYYSTTLFTEEHLKGRDVTSVMENHVKFAELAFKANYPGLTNNNQLGAFGSGGMLGGRSPEEILKMADDNKLIKAMIEIDPTLSTVEEAKQVLTRYAVGIQMGGYGLDVVNMSPNQRKFLNSQILRRVPMDKNDKDSMETFTDMYSDTYKLTPESGSYSDQIKAGHNASMKMVTEGGKEGAKAVKSNYQFNWLELQRKANNLNFPLYINEEGVPVLGDTIFVESDPDFPILGRVPVDIQARNKLAEEIQAFTTSVYELSEAGAFSVDEILTPPKFGSDIDKKGTELINRGDAVSAEQGAVESPIKKTPSKPVINITVPNRAAAEQIAKQILEDEEVKASGVTLEELISQMTIRGG